MPYGEILQIRAVIQLDSKKEELWIQTRNHKNVCIYIHEYIVKNKFSV
jgi:hypothetical protein